VTAQCRILRVHRSGYYQWPKEPHSNRSRENERPIGLIKQSYEDSDDPSGSPRVFKDLRELGEHCCENRVARLMRSNGIRAHRRYRKPRYRYSKPSLVSPNKLEQEFSVSGPDSRGVTDSTYINTSEDWLHVAVVIDLFSRKVVGWSMGHTITTDLALTALHGALWRRRPKNRVMIHSDRGVQFTSDAWVRLCGDHNVERSMSRRGNCYDNAVAESSFSSMREERVRGKMYSTLNEAHADIFDYIEAFYNLRRRHSALGMLSPAEFEQVEIGV
jgi:putative transposase